MPFVKYTAKNFRACGVTALNSNFLKKRGRAKTRQCKIWPNFYVEVRLFRIRTLPDFVHGTPLACVKYQHFHIAAVCAHVTNSLAVTLESDAT